jgi:hypothetical protein
MTTVSGEAEMMRSSLFIREDANSNPPLHPSHFQPGWQYHTVNLNPLEPRDTQLFADHVNKAAAVLGDGVTGPVWYCVIS